MEKTHRLSTVLLDDGVDSSGNQKLVSGTEIVIRLNLSRAEATVSLTKGWLVIGDTRRSIHTKRFAMLWKNT